MVQLPAVTLPGFLRRLLLSTSALLPAAMGVAQAQAPNAVPTGGQVSAGQATISQSGTHTQVTQGSNRAVVDWQRFDVGRNATVNFAQPNAQAWTLNRVTTPDPSRIAGQITANGGVAIVNQSGVVFAQGSQVNVGSLVASTVNITNQNFMAGRMVFDGAARAGARVENHGSITVADRGLAALVGPGVTNTGIIRARLGTAVVAGAETFRLDLAGDGMLSLEVTESVRRTASGGAALVTNSGVVEAQGGQVILSAHAASGLVEAVVRNTGRVAGRNVTVTGQGGNVEIAAGSVTARGGSVSITAPDAAVVVGPQARVSASSRTGGGQVQLGGATTAAVRVEGRVSARGTGNNATGGRVAVQARDSVTLAPTAVVNASGTAGGGAVLLGTTGVGRAQTMARETRVESGAVVRADATANGAGGTIVVNSAESTLMLGGLSARGGATGGDGGFVEVSGMRGLRFNLSRIDVSAPVGRGGTFLIDPLNIRVVADADMPADAAAAEAATGVAGSNVDAAPGNTVVANTDGTGSVLFIRASDLNAFAPGTTVSLQATETINIRSAISRPGDTLNLLADGAITQQATGTITAGTLVISNAAGTGSAGSAVLTLANSIGALDARTVGTLDVTTINTGAPLAVTRAQASAGAVTLTAGTDGATLSGPVGGTAINLNVSGAITGAGVVNTPGTLTVRGAAGGVTEAGSLSVTGANQITSLDARTTGNITVSNAQSLSVAQASASNAASQVSLTATSGTLSIPGTVSTGAGGTITLRADAMTFGGAAIINPSSTGTVVLTPNAANTGISVGGSGGLVLDPATLRAALFTNGGNRRVSILRLQTTGTGGVAVNAALDVGDGVTTGADTLQFNTNGAVTQAGGAIITAPLLGVRDATGLPSTAAASITLGEGNDVATLNANAQGVLVFGNARAGGLTVLSALSVDGGVTIAANGVISAPIPSGISALNATNGFVVLRPFAADAGFEIAMAAPAGGITTAHVANIASPRLSLQSTGTGALTVTNAFTSPSATLELAGNSIALGATVTGDNNGTVRLVSDAGLTGASGVTVGGTGTIEILPRSTGGNVTLGGAGAGINVSTAQFALMDAPTLVIGGMGLSRVGEAGPINTGNITITGDITRAAGTTLRLRAGGSVTQTGGVITAPNLSGYANGGEFTLSTGGVTPTANVITTIVTDGGTGIAASGNLRIDTNVALLTVNAPLRSGTRERDATTGAVLGTPALTNNTTLSLFADGLALAALVTAPSGTIQLQSFTTRRNVTLGAAGAGSLALDAASLGNLGDAANPTTVLRLGRAHADGATHNIGGIAVDGAVNLGTRVAHLELLASTDSTARSVTGAGIITVASLSAIAGGDVSLTGANSVATLARVTDAGAGTRANAGNVSLWSGVANGTAGSGTPGVLTFSNAGNLAVDGSVLASGANALTLTTTAGGTLTINPNVWVAAETGRLEVTAAGVLTNRGTIAAAPVTNDVTMIPAVAPGSAVTSGAGGQNFGVIALGLHATVPTTVTGFTDNSGYILADTLAGTLTSNSGLIVTSTGVRVTINDVGGAIIGGINDPGASFTNQGQVFGTVLAGTITNSGSILGASVVADTGTLTNTGTILTGALRAQGSVLHDGGEIGAGTFQGTQGRFNLTAQQARDGALARDANAAAPTPGLTANPTGSLTVESTAGNITQSAGTFTAPMGQSITFTSRTGEVTQAGGSITAPQIAVSAETSVTLDRAGNSFDTIIAWTAPPQLGAGTGAMAVPALPDAPTLASYGIAARTGAVTLQTSAPTLTVNADAGIRAGTDLRVQLNAANALLTLNAPLRSGTAGAGNSLLTLQADRMALNAVAGSMTLVAPGGTIRLRAETANQAINLGGDATDPAGSLNLGADELTRIGGLGADGLTTPAARLRVGADTAGAIAVTGNVVLRAGAVGVAGASQSRVTTLELVSGSGVTQDAGTGISVEAIAGRAGNGAFVLHDQAAHGAASLNAMDRIVAGVTDGTINSNGTPRDNLTATTDIAITSRRNLTVETPLIAGQDAILRVAPGTADGVLTVSNGITVGNARALALVADGMAIGANLEAPGGSIRVMPFTAGRNVTLGGEVANTLSLGTAELAFFGAGGTAASVLRIGRVNPAAAGGVLSTDLNANTAGNLDVAGSVDLRTRVTALELFAGSATGSISGAGIINVASLSGIAGGAVSLTGANTVDRLAGITDAGTFPNTAPAYVIAAPFLDNAGAILTRSIGNTALWAGAGNAQAGAPVASGVTFNNAGNLLVEGSVLNSGAGNLALTTTAGSNGNITVNAARWVAAENGTVTVTAGGTGILDNSGTIISASLGGGSVTSGGLGVNQAGAVIALGAPAGASGINGIAANSGLLYAGSVSGLTTNNATGRVWTQRDGLPGTYGTIGVTAGATNAGILVGAVNGAGAFTNQANGWVVGSLTAASVTNDATGMIAGTSVRATGTDVTNNGTINAELVRAARDVINNGTITAGGGSATLALTIPATSSGDVNAPRVREGAIRALTPTLGLTPAASTGATALTIQADTGNITNNAAGLITSLAMNSRVNLQSDQAISGNGRVVSPLLVLRGAAGGATRAGSFEMTNANNAVEVLDARSNRLMTAASERLIFGQTAGFRVTQADAGNGTVTLRSDGAIGRTGGVTTGVVGDLLTVRGAAGDATRAGSLNLADGAITSGNAIARLDARTNNAGLIFGQTAGFRVTQADAGTGAVTLGSDGVISGGPVIGTSLSVRGAGLGSTRAGGLDLPTGNAVATLDALVNNAALTFGQVAGFSVTQANAGTGNVALFSDGAITGTGGVTAGTLVLRGAAGGTSGAGSVNLVIGNAISSLDARTSNGALTFGQGGAISIAQLDTGTGNATLQSDGAISNIGLVNAALLTVRGAAGGTAAAESLTLIGANTIGALDVLVRGALAVNLASGTQLTRIGSSAGSVAITANGTLAITGPVAAGEDMTLRATADDIRILPGGALSGGRATTLTAARDVLQTGGSLSAGTALTITAGRDAIQTGGATSAVSLGTATQGASAGRDFLWNGGEVTLPTIHAVTAGQDLGLRSTGGATAVLGALNAGRNLAVETTAGALTLQGNVVRASAGTLGVTASGDLNVFNANLSAARAMTLRATGRLASNPSSFTAEDISLVSGAGMSFTQGRLTAARNLTAEAGGEISFQNSSLRAATNFATDASAFRMLRLSAGGSLALRNSDVTADRVEFVAGGAMTTAGSGFGIGTGLLLSARGGVGQANEALTTVAALDVNRLPLVIYDTRASNFLSRLPDLLTANTTDQPSRPFNAQTWQVPQVTASSGQIFFGVNDGVVTPPTNAAAGAIRTNLSAGSLPVFMLLNGGTASGTITAGRLGVYGLPGATALPNGRAVDLNGTLGAVGGESAARFGSLGSATGTQPSPLALDLYRFNNCVISSVNCVVPTFLQIPTIPLVNSVILGIQQPGFDDRDVLLPNVAEKDF